MPVWLNSFFPTLLLACLLISQLFARILLLIYFHHTHLLTTKALAFFHFSHIIQYMIHIISSRQTSHIRWMWKWYKGTKHKDKKRAFGWREREETRERNYVINSLTIMWIIQIYDFIPAIPTYRIYNCLMVLGSHTDGEIKKAGRGRQDLQIESAEAINFHLRW